MSPVSFFVPGEPKGAGSKVSGVAHRKDPATGEQVPVRDPATGKLKTFTKDSSAKGGEAWRADVRAEARAAMGERVPFEGPLAVQLVFWMPRPKGHYRSGKSAHLLRDDAPRWHASRPDVDKLVRAVLDAITGIVYRDDGQVCQMPTAAKPYTNNFRPGVHVVVTSPRLEAIVGDGAVLAAGGLAPTLFHRTAE